METNNDKLIADQLATLPVPLQRAIAITPWRKLVGEVAKANNLDPEKSEKLMMEAMFVMYGFEDQKDFRANIARELAIDPGQAKMLEEEVTMKVFSIVLARANDIQTKAGEETLQSVPDKPVETPIVEKLPESRPSINLILPKPEVKPLDLKPFIPVDRKPANIVENKLSQVIAIAPRVTAYSDGRDPYREPI